MLRWRSFSKRRTTPKFQVDPLERGFGLTLGNSLRRVLLSSMPGAAVTAVRIERIYHEFATIPGVKEDTTELLLNIKQLRLKSHSDQPVTLRLEAQGPGVVTAADLIYPSEIEIANPELHIATLDSPDARLDMELTVERGVGYMPSDGREAGAPGRRARRRGLHARFDASTTPSKAPASALAPISIAWSSTSRPTARSPRSRRWSSRPTS